MGFSKNSEVVKVFYRPTAITIDETQYPDSIFTAFSNEEMKNIGIYRFTEDKSGALRLTKNTGYSDLIDDAAGTVVRTYTYEDISQAEVDDLVARDKRKIKLIAKDLLSNTDWHVLRFVEDSTPIPAAVATKRNNIRNKAIEYTQALNAVTTVADLRAFYDATNLDEWPEGNDV